MSYLMTRKQLLKAVQANKYIGLRHYDNGRLYGYNCGILKTKLELKLDGDSGFQGYQVIDFMTYISIKLPFVR